MLSVIFGTPVNPRKEATGSAAQTECAAKKTTDQHAKIPPLDFAAAGAMAVSATSIKPQATAKACDQPKSWENDPQWWKNPDYIAYIFAKAAGLSPDD